MSSLDIEGVLSAHVRRLDPFSYHCACGQWRDKRDDGTGWAAHVAAFLREQFADVWDEGWDARTASAHVDGPNDRNTNPYRTDGE